MIGLDRLGIVSGWNADAERMFGYTVAQADGRDLIDLIVAPQDRAAKREELRQLVAAGVSTAKNLEITALRADGSSLDVGLAIGAPITPESAGPFDAFFRDLTEPKLAERARIASEQRFRALYESSRDAIIVLTPEAVVLSGNPAAIALFGCANAEEFTTLSPVTTSPEFQPDGTPSAVKAATMMARTLETGTHTFEWLHRRVDGETFWAEVMLTRMDIDGVLTVQASVRDIQERKRIEAELLSLNQDLETRIAARTAELVENTERTSRLIEEANDAVISIDQDSIVLDWNSAAERMFGWSRDEALGGSMHQMIVPPIYRPMHEAGIKRFLATGEATIINKRTQIKALHRDGHEIDVELALWPVKTGVGHTFSSFIRDISERKKADEALQQSEERYRVLVENANEGIAVAQDGYIKFGNDKMFALLDQTAEEVMTKPFLEQIHPEDRPRIYDNYVKRLQGDEVENFYTFRIVTPKDEIRSLQIGAVMIEWEGRPATLNFLSDVTERLAMQEDLRRALAQERELSDLKSRFVATTSHEFRTPLSTILSSSEMLEHYYDRLSAEERAELFRSVNSAVKRMSGMLDDVLRVGKAESGRSDRARMRFDLAAMCQGMIDEFRRAAPKNIVLNYIAPPPGDVVLDEKLLRQIFGNLISNAIKYSPEGGTVTIAVGRHLAKIEIVVADRGIGIPADDLPHLFESFHRARNVGNISGTGLGLNIVKESIEQQGGTISVESEVGCGTTFRVVIPVS